MKKTAAPVPKPPEPAPAAAADPVSRPGASWVILAAVAIAALIWTSELYTPAGPAFPRASGDFRPAAEREKARAAALAVVEKDPENIAAWTELAVLGYESGPDGYVQALEALERARDLGALDDRFFFYAGVMYESSGLPDYARPEYLRYLRRHPEDNEVRLRLANLHFRVGDLDKAIEEYRRVLAANPEDAVVAYNLALACRDRRLWAEGLQVLLPVAREGAPAPEGTHKLLGDLHRGAGDYAAALRSYHAELARAKDDAAVGEALALTYEAMNDLPEAIAQWKRLLEANPKNRQAREKIRTLERKQKAAERAAKARK